MFAVHEVLKQRQTSPSVSNALAGTDFFNEGLAAEQQKKHSGEVPSAESRIDRAAVTVSSTPYLRRHGAQEIKRAPPPAKSTLIPWIQRQAPMQSSAYGGYRAPSVHFDGLRNLGNTCYLNAVMQSFCSLREFVEELLNMRKKVPQFANGQLFSRTEEVLQQMQKSQANSGGPVNPARLREQIALGNPMFGSSGQQDAHEFLLEYISQLHDELLEKREEPVTGVNVAHGADTVLATQAYFDSTVLKRIECIQCNHQREVTEKFRDFSLDFPKENASEVTLEAMLKEYFSMELIDARCEKCQCNAARLFKEPFEWPRVLVLHLKRFLPNIQQGRYDKRHERVKIPLLLDVPNSGIEVKAGATQVGHGAAATVRELARPLVVRDSGAESPPDAGTPSRSEQIQCGDSLTRSGGSSGPPGSPGSASQPRYNLRAVVAHEGLSPQAGHYVTFARSSADKWQLFDDSTVRDLSALPNDLGSRAYILFYVLGDRK
jgi:ubiquitin C-terminal hydrolase